MRCMATAIGESGFEAQPGPIIVSGYSGVCFEIKISNEIKFEIKFASLQRVIIGVDSPPCHY